MSDDYKAHEKGKGVQFDPGGTWFHQVVVVNGVVSKGSKIGGVFVTGDPHGTGQSQETYFLTENYVWPSAQAPNEPVYHAYDQSVVDAQDMYQKLLAEVQPRQVTIVIANCQRQ
jgi:hypothetical protein